MQPLLNLSLPLLFLSGVGIVILLAAPKLSGRLALLLSGLATVASFLFCWLHWRSGFPFSQQGLVFDRLAWGFDLLFLLSLFLTLLLSSDYLKQEGIRLAEYYALLLFATVGMMLVSHGGDLLVIFWMPQSNVPAGD